MDAPTHYTRAEKYNADSLYELDAGNTERAAVYAQIANTEAQLAAVAASVQDNTSPLNAEDWQAVFKR